MANYINNILDTIHNELPGLTPELASFYALLALTKGKDTTLEDVHDAWAVWTVTVRGRPDHPSLVPFIELSYDVQELDRKYTEGIHNAAKTIGR